MTDNIEKLLDLERNNGERFQKDLAKLAMQNGFKTIVESGAGVSSVFFLYYMKHTKDMEDAKLYSIDPDHWYENEIVCDQHELIKGKSIDEMWKLYKRTGAWDMFLHDGNHDIKCQTYEFEFAFSCLRKGGILACDDYTWGQHNAWTDFLNRNKLKSTKLGDVEYVVQETDFLLDEELIQVHHEYALQLAEEAEAVWLAKGNKNSDLFKD